MLGDDFAEMLLQTNSSCRKCGVMFSFEEGVSCARRNGITSKVVMCPKCHSVYEVNVAPRGMTLLADVTGRYAVRQATSNGGSSKASTFFKALLAIVIGAFCIAVYGEFFLVRIIGLSRNSTVYFILISLLWIAGIVSGVLVRKRSWRFILLYCGVGLALMILLVTLFPTK
jgi:hypothetical protein